MDRRYLDRSRWTVPNGTVRPDGMVIGGALGIAVSQMFGGALYGVTALSPRVLGASIVITAIVTTAATFVPARRASQINPITALRE